MRNEKGIPGRSLCKVALLAFALVASNLDTFARAPFEARTEESFPLPPKTAFTLENIDGSIHIYGWKESRVRLVALRRAYTMARLNQIQFEIIRRPASINLQTHIPAAHGFFGDRSGTVDYTVTVPETANLERLRVRNGEIVLEGLRGGSAKAEVTNGRITALNCYGRVRGRVVTGALSSFQQWWENLPGLFEFAGGQATIRVRLPVQAQFKIDAETANGHIENGFRFRSKRHPPSGEWLKGETRSDAPVLFHLRTTAGNISLVATN